MDVSSIALGGLQQAQGQVEKAASRISAAGSGSPADTVDLSQNMVALLSAKSEFSANLNVLKVADEMQKSLVSVLG